MHIEKRDPIAFAEKAAFNVSQLPANLTQTAD